jgi:hypothetical protein
LLQRFPGRTAADLYVWIWSYIFDAYQRLGEKVDPDEAAAAMEKQAPSAFQQAVQGLMGHIAEASHSLVSGRERIPEWVNQTFEWDDGSLNALADQARDLTRGDES